jgi:recombination protein RecR
MRFPKSIQNLIDQFVQFPSIGPKTAERFVFYLLGKDPSAVENLADALKALHKGAILCSRCLAFAETSPCAICSDSKRDSSIIAVIADTRALIPIESTGDYKGLYFVLGGEINPIDGIGPERLAIKQLLDRISEGTAKEIIIALNPTIEGESTALYLAKAIRSLQISVLKISRIARGLPMGADIEYADEATLGNAMKYRNEL